MTEHNFKPVSEQRVERWLGAEKVASLRQSMQGWYGTPINIADMPGSVWIDKDGTFTGEFNRGYFFGALDAFEHFIKHLNRASKQPQFATFGAGFTSVSDALARASGGFSQRRPLAKAGPAGVALATSSLWRVGPQPAAGAAGAAAPGGTAHNSASAGALAFANPTVGALRLVGSDVSASLANSTLLVYDRLFSVAKTMNSATAEAVTGVPTRYQSIDPLSALEDYIGDNFLFIEIGGTALAATAHNWTACTYLDQNNASSTLPDVVGNSGGIVDRLDQPVSTWFCPLAAGDNGVKALTNMQCSVAVATGAVNFVIGHPIGFMSFPVVGSLLPFDWLTNRDQAPKVMNDACLSFLDVQKPATTAATYNGRLYLTSTAS